MTEAQSEYAQAPDLRVLVGEALAEGSFRGVADVLETTRGHKGKLLVIEKLCQFADCGRGVRAERLKSGDAPKLHFRR